MKTKEKTILLIMCLTMTMLGCSDPSSPSASPAVTVPEVIDYAQVEFVNRTNDTFYVSAFHNGSGTSSHASWWDTIAAYSTHTEKIENDDITGTWNFSYDVDASHTDGYKYFESYKTLDIGHLYTCTISGSAYNPTSTITERPIE